MAKYQCQGELSMEKLPQDVVDFVLSQIEQGNFEVTNSQIIIDIVKKQLPKNIYKLKSGRYNVKIHCPKTKKKLNLGTFNTVQEAINARDVFFNEQNKSSVIPLHSFRNNN